MSDTLWQIRKLLNTFFKLFCLLLAKKTFDLLVLSQLNLTERPQYHRHDKSAFQSESHFSLACIFYECRIQKKGSGKQL